MARRAFQPFQAPQAIRNRLAKAGRSRRLSRGQALQRGIATGSASQRHALHPMTPDDAIGDQDFDGASCIHALRQAILNRPAKQVEAGEQSRSYLLSSASRRSWSDAAKRCIAMGSARQRLALHPDDAR